MDEEKLIEFLKKNLSIEINEFWDDDIRVSLFLRGEEISTANLRLSYASKYHNHNEEG